MGCEKLVTFINKSINNPNTLDEIDYNNSNQMIQMNHILIDLNFLIYIGIQNVENDINDLINIILSLSYSNLSSCSYEKNIENIIKKENWQIFYEKIISLLDGINQEEIISNLTNFLITENNNELLILGFIKNKIRDWINNIHSDKFLKSICIFVDGIPSTSKIFEQRRRRIKNHYEGLYRRDKFNYYFDNINYELVEINNYKVNYMKTLNSRISLSKSIGPSSKIMEILMNYLKNELIKDYPDVNIHISDSYEYGEADFKLFKYIDKMKISGDISIHTSDSDLYLQTIIQQIISLEKKTDKRFTVIKHHTKKEAIYQRLHCRNFVKNIIDLFQNRHNKSLNNLNFLDLLFTFLLFGNDHIPNTIQFGPELGLNFIFDKYHESIYSKNLNILKEVNNQFKIDYKVFSEFLDSVNSSEDLSVTKIFFNRNIKMNNNLYSLLFQDLKLNYLEINDLITKFWIYEGYNLLKKNNKLKKYEDDIRIDLFNKWEKENENKIPEDPFIKYSYSDKIKKKIIIVKKNIYNYLDPLNKNYLGFILYQKEMLMNSNVYQNIYINLLNESQIYFTNISNNISKLLKESKYPSCRDDLIKKLGDNIIEDYLISLQYLVDKFFGDMMNYNPCNFWNYKHYDIPDLKEVSKFIKESNSHNEKFEKILSDCKVKKNKYFDYISHQIFITPFLDYQNIENYIEISDSRLLNITKDIIINSPSIVIDRIEDFNYKDVNSKLFIEKWLSLLKKIYLVNKKKQQKVEHSLYIDDSG